MQAAPFPPDEAERLAALRQLDLLDTPDEPVFDRITRVVARTLDVPIALVSLVDADRQWFKSKVGLAARETPREVAFCAHTILRREPLVVEDASRDERFHDNPLVVAGPAIRFYAAVPIFSLAGKALGTLCAIDSRPRRLSGEELGTLMDLAAVVSDEIHQRETARLAHQHAAAARTSLEDSEDRFRTVFELADVGIAMVAPDGRWLRVNGAMCRIVGYAQEELSQLAFQDITYPDDLGKDLRLAEQLVSGEIDRFGLEKRYVRKSGEPVWVHLSVTKKTNAAGELEYFVAIVQDIQARKEAEASLAALRRDLEARVEERTRELRSTNEMLSYTITQQVRFEKALLRREAELSAVIANANDAYVCIDAAGVVTAWNRAAEETFGWSAEEAVGRRLDELIIPPQKQAAHRAGMRRYFDTGEGAVLNRRLELTAMRRDGTRVPVEVRVCALDIDGQKIFSAFLHDITERKRVEAARDWEARHDPLTGLPNRRALLELLPKAIARSNRNGRALALLFLDLDGFKAVNDGMGHAAGDSMLREIARRLSDCLRQTDTVARLAGDEFVVLLEDLPGGADDAGTVAGKLLDSLRQPVQLGAERAHITASVGIVLHPPGCGKSPDELVRLADAAMYEAKGLGKDRVTLADGPAPDPA